MVFNVRESNRSIKTTFPRQIKKLENIWIPLSDGTRLSAHIWLPIDAEEHPVPAILEYIPYRKDDFTALRDSIRHPYFAGHGYASIRVDLRGSGNSEGIIYDEYLKQEQDDGLEVLSWIAKQPWFSGGIGMIGKSWGGFNGLQIAARRHPNLKAIITLCSTDDRFVDDVHYKGGALLASDMLWWASTMLAYNARPADPLVVGDAWKANWMERLEKTPPFVEEWMRHQRRDDYWKHGSVCEDYRQIDIPVYAVGGWADGYTDAVLRLLEGLSGPRKGLIGPWAHEYPEVAVPGPQIGFLQECLRWWDKWLKGIETGVMEGPMLRAWIQDSVPPQTDYSIRPGFWVGESKWPVQERRPIHYHLSEQQLVEQSHSEGVLEVPSVQQHGLYAGVWCPFGQRGDLPADQRLENGMSVNFLAPPASEPVDILGHPTFTVELSSDQPNALLTARLNDVAPDGAVTRVTWGMLNLTHRNSHEHPEPLVPGEKYQITLKLNAVGHRLAPGHRWQLSISPTYWPHAWPSPEPVTLSVYTNENTYLSLPVRPYLESDAMLPPFEQPETAAVIDKEILREANRTREIHHDIITNTYILDDFSDEGARRLPATGIEYGSTNRNIYTITEEDPLSAKVQCDWTLTVGRGEWQTRLETTSTMTADETKFYLVNLLTAFDGDQEVFNKVWKTVIPRDHM